MISSSRVAELQRAPPAWKFCAVQSQERFDRENAQRADQANMNGRRVFDCRKWKTTARPRKTLPGSPDQGQQNKRAREEPSRDHPQGPRGSVPRGSLQGVARVLQAAQLHLRPQEAVLLPDCRRGPRGWPTSGSSSVPERAHQSELGFEQQNRFRNSQEIQRIEKKAFRARADAAQSARQAGTEPGTTRFRDGRATAGPPAPRRGPGAPTAEPRPRPRGPDLESANSARSKICDFGPELGFELE